MAKSLGWKRFDHYSIAVPDAEAAIAFHCKLFGLAVHHSFDTPGEGFRGAMLDMPGGQGQIELMAPQGEDSFLHEFLAAHGPGLHHVTVEVEDVDQAAAYLREEMGIEPFRGVFSDGRWKQTFVHPRDTGGVLYQLYQWEPGQRPPELPERGGGVN